LFERLCIFSENFFLVFLQKKFTVFHPNNDIIYRIDFLIFHLWYFTTKERLMNFEEIFNKYFELICRFLARKLRNAHDAEDVAQETFIAFHEQYRHKKDFDNLKGLLLQIASNKAIDLLRQLRRAKLLPMEDFKEQPAFEEPLLTLRLEINLAIAKLPKKQRLVIDTRYFGGYTLEETAELLGLTLEQVKYQYKKAKERLCNVLRDYGKEL